METEWILLVALGIAGLFGLGATFFWLLRTKGRRKQETSITTSRGTQSSGLFSALRRTREQLQAMWAGAGGSGALEVLEEALVGADVGVEMARQLVKRLSATGTGKGDPLALKKALAEELVRVFQGNRATSWNLDGANKPKAIVMVGVNGVGKTTSVAKLAWWFRGQGRRVLVVAADTFRAAAGEQLQTWSERLGISCVRHQAGADPAAVVYDGLQAAQARGMDIVIVDTAGRLHSKQHLVEELRKIVRIAQKQLGEENVEVLLVIDATSGQNAVVQARVLSEAVPVTGVCLTKLDGTAKGGVAVPIAAKLGLPIRFVGFGEDLQDWQEFDPRAFVSALLGEGLDREPGRTADAGLGQGGAVTSPA